MTSKRIWAAAVAWVIWHGGADTQEPVPKLPPVTVTETRRADDVMAEEVRIGPAQQPEWTTKRRFATTRAYVIEEGQIEFESWWKGKFLRNGKPEHLLQEEIEVGLPWRFQLDLYENFLDTPTATMKHQGSQVEARWALAPWGAIPLNPTLYAEWKFNDRDPDAYEVKLLLAEEFGSRWHWAFNVFFEQEVSGGRATEMGFSQAVSYTLCDEKLSAGIEMNFEHTTEDGSRGHPEIEFLLGPSLQYRPLPGVHLDFVPLIGLTHDSPRVEAFAILGIDFGGAKEKGESAPASARGR